MTGSARTEALTLGSDITVEKHFMRPCYRKNVSL